MKGLITNASYTNWPKVASGLGCADTATQLQCMRAKNTSEIINGAKALGSGFPPKFVPIPDGKVAFDDYPQRMEKGLFVKEPFIIGNNDREVPDPKLADAEFTCPAARVVNSRSGHKVPTWRYRFYGGGPSTTNSTSPLAALVNPASHAAELTYVFGTLGGARGNGLLPSVSATPQRVAVSNEFQAVWGAFAKDPHNGPTKLGWPVYNPMGASAFPFISF